MSYLIKLQQCFFPYLSPTNVFKEQHSQQKNCISVIYNTFIYAYMPHTYATVN